MNLKLLINTNINNFFKLINKELKVNEGITSLLEKEFINQIKIIILNDTLKINEISIKNLNLIINYYKLPKKLIDNILDIIISGYIFIVSNILYLNLINNNRMFNDIFNNIYSIKFNENNLLFLFKILLKSSELLQNKYNEFDSLIVKVRKNKLALSLLQEYELNLDQFIIKINNKQSFDNQIIIKNYLGNQIEIILKNIKEILKTFINYFENYLNDTNHKYEKTDGYNEDDDNDENENEEYERLIKNEDVLIENQIKSNNYLKNKMIDEIEININYLINYNKKLIN